MGVIFGAMADAGPRPRHRPPRARPTATSSSGRGRGFRGALRLLDDLEMVGYGGRCLRATATTPIDSINGNCRITPTEVYETRFPWRVERLSLNVDGGGPGQHLRPGLGYTKQMLCLNEEITCSTDDRPAHPAGLGPQGR
ncbi:MAG: hydantoinase B/oxoprolinase family protein [Arhodomonas sp.]|nr:hydantoinase B/oxoprolinase family protein [Arhodomonas sp.]